MGLSPTGIAQRHDAHPIVRCTSLDTASVGGTLASRCMLSRLMLPFTISTPGLVQIGRIKSLTRVPISMFKMDLRYLVIRATLCFSVHAVRALPYSFTQVPQGYEVFG